LKKQDGDFSRKMGNLPISKQSRMSTVAIGTCPQWSPRLFFGLPDEPPEVFIVK
jgi:hypothetical protein